MEIWLVRYALSEADEVGLLSVHSESMLTRDGRQQARELASLCEEGWQIRYAEHVPSKATAMALSADPRPMPVLRTHLSYVDGTSLLLFSDTLSSIREEDFESMAEQVAQVLANTSAQSPRVFVTDPIWIAIATANILGLDRTALSRIGAAGSGTVTRFVLDGAETWRLAEFAADRTTVVPLQSPIDLVMMANTEAAPPEVAEAGQIVDAPPQSIRAATAGLLDFPEDALVMPPEATLTRIGWNHDESPVMRQYASQSLDRLFSAHSID